MFSVDKRNAFFQYIFVLLYIFKRRHTNSADISHNVLSKDDMHVGGGFQCNTRISILVFEIVIVLYTDISINKL